ncbi:MAG: MSHA biogenesis protein MshI [Pseudohongiellaceae bacterium]|jgi:MSHA biogenesis protein MshI
MQFFKKKAKSNSRIGVLVSSEWLAVAHMGERDGGPYLIDFQRVALQSEKDAGKALSNLVKSMEIEDKQCSFVLNRKDYNLHLVEAPEVEASELRAAVRWKIKDLLDMKVEDAAIDVFQVPEDAYRGRSMVYVVAALNSKIKNIVSMVTESGLELAVIDIPELAMKNLSNSFVDDTNGAAFLDLRRNGSTMNITRNGELYLSRRINTQLDPNVMSSADWESVKDRLSLEIQRSLDYYESQMGQSPITRIVLAQRQHDGGAMSETLNSLLTAEVKILDLANHLESDKELSPEIQQIGMAAIGATLRGKGKVKKPESGKQEAA